MFDLEFCIPPELVSRWLSFGTCMFFFAFCFLFWLRSFSWHPFHHGLIIGLVTVTIVISGRYPRWSTLNVCKPLSAWHQQTMALLWLTLPQTCRRCQHLIFGRWIHGCFMIFDDGWYLMDIRGWMIFDGYLIFKGIHHLILWVMDVRWYLSTC